MTQVNRIDGGLIDRSTPLGFTFDGRRYGGFAGDTLASALVANGVRLVGRSFKYCCSPLFCRRLQQLETCPPQGSDFRLDKGRLSVYDIRSIQRSARDHVTRVG